MSGPDAGGTTASIEAVPRTSSALDTPPGLVLVYSRLHEHLPAALVLTSTVTTIGRESDNALTIPEAAVSRYHAQVERRSDGWWIVDRGSTNGTLVNGIRIDAQRLQPHDVVRVGDTLLRYAAIGAARFAAYRLDGSVVENARPVSHTVRGSSLVGGYHVDALLAHLDRVAPTELSVVVAGESGTGKELVAREIHRLSGRRGPFQAINCAALPATLLESELFGYRRGAFTGASSDKLGLVQAADGGTLFLDEVGDMALEAQAKLLRVLQEKEVLPLGATSPRSVDVRVVCATHRDLDALVAEGHFRGDLLARLREVPITLPPLRERREDLLPLVRHFLTCAGRPTTEVSFPFMLALAHYDWPYNVRELESAVKLALALSKGAANLDLEHLPATVRSALDGHGEAPVEPSARNPEGTRASRKAPTDQELRELLAHHLGNIAAVGRELGKERMQIHRWLKRYGIDPSDYRP